MATVNCKCCGHTNAVVDSILVKCVNCGSMQTLPLECDEKKATLYNRAHTLRMDGEFDRALSVCETLINDYPDDCEAYWAMFLCSYGVIYTEDPYIYRTVPVCHRMQDKAPLENEYYLKAIETASPEVRAVYESEAAQLAEIYKRMEKVSSSEKQYDIFLCSREDERDRILAEDIYHALVKEEYRVFDADITLKDMPSVQHEPYIFAALSTAKVMIVTGTKSESFNSTGVRDKWSRFLELKRADNTRRVFSVYRNTKAEEIPDALSVLDTRNMSESGFWDSFISDIKSVVLPSHIRAASETKEMRSVDPEKLYYDGVFALKSGSFREAGDIFDKITETNGSNAEAFLGKLMSELKYRNENEFLKGNVDFSGSESYKKTVACGDEAINARLAEYLNTAKYNYACELLSSADTEKKYSDAKSIFTDLGTFKDSTEKTNECDRLLAEFEIVEKRAKERIDNNKQVLESRLEEILGRSGKKEEIYESIAKQVRADEAQKIEMLAASSKKKKLAWAAKLAAAFVILTALSFVIYRVAGISGWQPVPVFILAVVLLCGIIRKYGNDKAYYEMGKNYESEGRFLQAIEAYEKLDNYSSLSVNAKYSYADMLANSKQTEDAVKVYMEIENYRDSKEKAMKLIEGMQTHDNRNINVTVGEYNGKPVEWRLLDIDEESALLISSNILLRKEFNTKYTDVKWENSSLRKWLNGDFYSSVFANCEKALIKDTSVVNRDNFEYGHNVNYETIDKVYLLSLSEAEKYFRKDSDRKSDSWWWLRTPGDHSGSTAFVFKDGSLFDIGSDVNNSGGGVRPVIRLKRSV